MTDSALDRSIALRAEFGLDSGRDHVRALLGSSRDVGSQRFGMTMTKAEAQAVDLDGRTDFVVAVARDVVPFIETLSIYAGEWVDQKNDGELVVLLTERDESVIDQIRTRMPKPSRGLRIEIVSSSYDDLESALDRSSDVSRNIEASAQVSLGEIDIRRNRLNLSYPSPAAARMQAADAELESRLGVKVRVTEKPLPKQRVVCGNNNNTGPKNCWNPIPAGARIYWNNSGNSWICTMGFHVVKGGQKQWLTAGHCVYDPDQSKKMFHSGYFHNGQNIGERVGNLYNATDRIDAARIDHKFPGAEATDWIFNTDKTHIMADPSSPIVGATVWARGATTMLLDNPEFKNKAISGTIKSKTAQWFSETKDIMVNGATAGNFNPRGGDSGGPVYYKSSFNGTAIFHPVGIVNDDILPEDNEPGKYGFAIVTTVLNKMGATIYKQ